jgi:hypothetical protein
VEPSWLFPKRSATAGSTDSQPCLHRWKPLPWIGIVDEETAKWEFEAIDPAEVIADFQRIFLPILLTNTTPEAYGRALLAEEFAPGVPHFWQPLYRATRACEWGQFTGDETMKNQAVDIMRTLARAAVDPTEREAIDFAWTCLDLPGKPI